MTLLVHMIKILGVYWAPELNICQCFYQQLLTLAETSNSAAAWMKEMNNNVGLFLSVRQLHYGDDTLPHTPG